MNKNNRLNKAKEERRLREKIVEEKISMDNKVRAEEESQDKQILDNARKELENEKIKLQEYKANEK